MLISSMQAYPGEADDDIKDLQRKDLTWVLPPHECFPACCFSVWCYVAGIAVLHWAVHLACCFVISFPIHPVHALHPSASCCHYLRRVL